VLLSSLQLASSTFFDFGISRFGFRSFGGCFELSIAFLFKQMQQGKELPSEKIAMKGLKFHIQQ
jgi:hypothetical protein